MARHCGEAAFTWTAVGHGARLRIHGIDRLGDGTITGLKRSLISTAAADLPPVLGGERSLLPSWRVFKCAIACGGVAWVLMQLLLGYQMGIFPYPGDTLIWDRVGDQLRAGQPIYYLADPATDSFWYAPPWAVLFGALSWLPVGILGGLILATKIAALRVIGGSWIGAGIACWFPLVAYDLAGGCSSSVLAAAIVSAVH